MSKKMNRLVTLVLFIVVASILFANRGDLNKISSDLNQQQPPVDSNITAFPSPTAEVPASESYSFVATSSGQSALTLVQSQVELSLKEYDFGTMIEGVNGLMADSKHYWALYQAGDYAKTGIADLKLNKDEVIELKYEEIKF
jgi:hypothetical protein